jgi:hypothetical protein
MLSTVEAARVSPVPYEHADADHHDERAEGRERHPPADHLVDSMRSGEHLPDLGEASGLLGRVRCSLLAAEASGLLGRG